MGYNNLPPQAYTKEDVAKAYVWLQTQPDYVKNMATNKETLVTLYLQARRNGTSSLENIAPVSSKNFKSQLQSLASELEQFENEISGKAPTSVTAPLPTYSMPEAPVATKKPEEQTVQQTIQEFQKPVTHQATLPIQDQKSIHLALDPRSEQIIRSVKSQLNMDSERDIVRMLLVLGYDRIKGIFPNR